MGSFKHRCPNPRCRRVLAVPDKKRGSTVRCANCGQAFFVPFVVDIPRQGPGPLRKAS